MDLGSEVNTGENKESHIIFAGKNVEGESYHFLFYTIISLGS